MIPVRRHTRRVKAEVGSEDLAKQLNAVKNELLDVKDLISGLKPAALKLQSSSARIFALNEAVLLIGKFRMMLFSIQALIEYIDGQ